MIPDVVKNEQMVIDNEEILFGKIDKGYTTLVIGSNITEEWCVIKNVVGREFVAVYTTKARYKLQERNDGSIGGILYGKVRTVLQPEAFSGLDEFHERLDEYLADRRSDISLALAVYDTYRMIKSEQEILFNSKPISSIEVPILSGLTMDSGYITISI